MCLQHDFSMQIHFHELFPYKILHLFYLNNKCVSATPVKTSGQIRAVMATAVKISRPKNPIQDLTGISAGTEKFPFKDRLSIQDRI